MLKNKDGTRYSVFSSPNPIVRGQEQWDEKNLVFHNHFGKEFVVASLESLSEPVQHESSFLEALKEADAPVVKKRPKNIVIFHCLPAIYTNKDVYGETFLRKSWGEKITFEGVVISIEDLQMIFWTTYDISKGSIVYPMRYADTNETFDERRWWKVSELEEKDGLIVKAVPSDESPDFSK